MKRESASTFLAWVLAVSLGLVWIGNRKHYPVVQSDAQILAYTNNPNTEGLTPAPAAKVAIAVGGSGSIWVWDGNTKKWK